MARESRKGAAIKCSPFGWFSPLPPQNSRVVVWCRFLCIAVQKKLEILKFSVHSFRIRMAGTQFRAKSGVIWYINDCVHDNGKDAGANNIKNGVLL